MPPSTFRDALHHPCSWSEIDRLSREATDYDARGPDGSTILMLIVKNVWSIKNESQSDIIRRLVERGVDVNARDAKGLSAMCYACNPLNTWVFWLLVELGDSIDAACINTCILRVNIRPVRLAVLATPKFCEDMARMVVEMFT